MSFSHAVVFQKTFIGGTLEGLTIQERVRFADEVKAERFAASLEGLVVKRPAGGSPYRMHGVQVVQL